MLSSKTKSEFINLLEKLDKVTETDLSFLPKHHEFFVDMVKNGESIAQTLSTLLLSYLGSEQCELAPKGVNDRIKDDVSLILSYADALKAFYNIQDIEYRRNSTKKLQRDVDNLTCKCYYETGKN